MMRLTSIFALLAFCAARPAHADTTAHSCRATGPARPIVERNACAGFVIGKTRVRFPFQGSGRLLSSSDGRTVAMLQSYLYGRLDKRDVVAFAGDERNPKALYIYRDGKLVAAHRIHDLVKRRRLLWPSVSHVRWVRSASIAPDGRLTLTTTGFRQLIFDGQTGALTRATDAPDWRSCAVIAGGRLDRPGKKLIRPFDYKRAQSSAQALSFAWGAGIDPRKLTHKAHTVGCFVRRGSELVFARPLPL